MHAVALRGASSFTLLHMAAALHAYDRGGRWLGDLKRHGLLRLRLHGEGEEYEEEGPRFASRVRERCFQCRGWLLLDEAVRVEVAEKSRQESCYTLQAKLRAIRRFTHPKGTVGGAPGARHCLPSGSGG